MSAPLISCIIPTRNRAELLHGAIASVLAQEACGAEIETIVVDDGSTDATREVVVSFPGVRYLPTRQGTAGGSRNVGLTAARGEWIAFLDDDDLWLPQKLRIYRETSSRWPAARFLVSDATLCDAALQPCGLWVAPDLKVGDDPFPRLFGATLTASVMMVHREIFDRVGGFDLAIPRAEDQDLCLRIAAAGFPCCRIPEALTLYRNRDRFPADLLERAFRDTLNVLTRHAGTPAGRRLGRLRRQRALLRVRGWYAAQMVREAQHCAEDGQARDAARLRRQALGASPLHYARATLRPRF